MFPSPAIFLHVMRGSGTPETLQGKKTSSPSTASASFGFEIHSGGTAEGRKRD